MSRPDIHKEPPPALYIVKIDAESSAGTSYRICWSIKHASNYAERQTKIGRGASIIEYQAGAELARFKPTIKEASECINSMDQDCSQA